MFLCFVFSENCLGMEKYARIFLVGMKIAVYLHPLKVNDGPFV